MKAKLIWANFSVKDAAVSREFYSALGFTPTPMNKDPKLASFLFGDNEFVIHFFQQGSQIDEYLTPEAARNSEIIFTLSAETEQEVHEWAERVRAAGGNLFTEPTRDNNNYFGFAFADPDGHKFNVLLMEKGM